MRETVHKCTCQECKNEPSGQMATVHAGMNLMVSTLDEKNRRRFAGLWARRARAQWHSVKSELERDLAAEDLRRSLQDTQAAMREAQAALREAGGDARRGLDTLGDGLMQGTSPPPTIAAPDATQTDAADAPPEADDRAR